MMSATNRSPRGGDARDFFPTPKWLVEAIVPELQQRIPKTGAVILEPACGDGAIVDVLRQGFPSAEIVGVDLAQLSRTDLIGGVDFLTTDPSPEFDLVITNSPWSLAMEFIEHALKFRRPRTDLHVQGLVVMLLRINFFASQGRAKRFRELRPSLYITPRRPSFTDDGKTDAADYCWAFFDGRGEIHWLETERFVLETKSQ